MTKIPVTNVTIPHSFAVGLYEISVGQFRYFIQSTDYAANGSCYAMQRGRWAWQDELSWENPGFDQGDSYPVVCVSWEDAKRIRSMVTPRNPKTVSFAGRSGVGVFRAWNRYDNVQVFRAG